MRQDKFLGAVRSQWELSLSLPVGLGTRRPPTYVGARDHRPTAFSAPRFNSWDDAYLRENFAGPRQGASQGRGAGAPSIDAPRSSPSVCRAARQRGREVREDGARANRLGLSSDVRRAGHFAASRRPRRRGFAYRSARRRAAWSAVGLSPLEARRQNFAGRHEYRRTGAGEPRGRA